jgi:hypothetical protein
MCQALRELMKDEIEKEVNTAVSDTKVEAIKSVMKNFKCSVDEAMDALDIPPQKRSTYLSKL